MIFVFSQHRITKLVLLHVVPWKYDYTKNVPEHWGWGSTLPQVWYILDSASARRAAFVAVIWWSPVPIRKSRVMLNAHTISPIWCYIIRVTAECMVKWIIKWVTSMDFDMSWIKSCLPKKHDYTWQKEFPSIVEFSCMVIFVIVDGILLEATADRLLNNWLKPTEGSGCKDSHYIHCNGWKWKFETMNLLIYVPKHDAKVLTTRARCSLWIY
jgi:hypothetical protein